MFGANRNNKNNTSFMGFDLEKDLEDEHKLKAHLSHTEAHIHEIKKQLRQGAKPEDFEGLGVLLHGYSALLKILTKAKEK